MWACGAFEARPPFIVINGRGTELGVGEGVFLQLPIAPARLLALLPLLNAPTVAFEGNAPRGRCWAAKYSFRSPWLSYSASF